MTIVPEPEIDAAFGAARGLAEVDGGSLADRIPGDVAARGWSGPERGFLAASSWSLVIVGRPSRGAVRGRAAHGRAAAATLQRRSRSRRGPAGDPCGPNAGCGRRCGGRPRAVMEASSWRAVAREAVRDGASDTCGSGCEVARCSSTRRVSRMTRRRSPRCRRGRRTARRAPHRERFGAAYAAAATTSSNEHPLRRPRRSDSLHLWRRFRGIGRRLRPGPGGPAVVGRRVAR